ncbi:hypothetical protein GCM10012275_03810 [Longimycelium tulufanense]|uniref:Uncharacterized protein n=1 Tax=Longimycelium tulufanense TaxID=907463 RepID=A0A8J3C9V6_9PSEU|nr:hypothetical protein [Longimycelium tulufanense]GGM35814.1 hypothetical protein GCM10012275_03810 [Longimycelium tulufanense]
MLPDPSDGSFVVVTGGADPASGRWAHAEGPARGPHLIAPWRFSTVPPRGPPTLLDVI